MKFINHNDFKNELFKSVKFKEEYEKLDSIYEIKKQMIRYNIGNNLY